MQNNLDTLLQTVSQYKLFPLERQLVVAVSGGADSLALMHWLAQNRAHIAPHLHIATLNHSIRPQATTDTQFVADQATHLSLPVTVGRVDVPAFATENQLSIETAARQLRYDFLAKVAREIGAQHIATAHHADDQAETILMHIIRGAGINGLQGMDFSSPTPYNPDITLLRPFLTLLRAEIEVYCTQHHLKPRHDETNDDTDYTRNKLRQDVVPHLQTMNPSLNDALLRLSALARTENDFVTRYFQEHCQPHMIFDKRVSITRHAFKDWHRALQRRAVLKALDYLHGEPSYDLIENAIDLALTGQVGSIAQFIHSIQLRVDYDHIRIEHAHHATQTTHYFQLPPENDDQKLTIPGITVFDTWQIETTQQRPATFDARLAFSPSADVRIRTRRPGDKFQPLGMHGKHKSIKNWCIDRKIPRNARQGLPLVTIDGIIAAIILPQAWEIAEWASVHINSQYIVYFKSW